MSESKYISVVVPLYNEEKNLHRCIESIRSQSIKNIEIILVDDGSVDNSAAICREYESLDNRIKFVQKENGGLASARNFGLKYVTAPFVSFIDSDDWVEPEFLEKLYQAIISKEHPADLSICAYCRDYGEQKTPFVSAALRTDNRDDLIIHLLESKSYSNAAWNKMYRMEVIAKHGIQFDPKYSIGEDFGFSIAYALVCKGCNYVPEQLYHYMMNPFSMMHKMKSDTIFNQKWLKEWDVVNDCQQACCDCGNNVLEAFEERKFSIALKLLSLMKKCHYSPDNYTKDMLMTVRGGYKYFVVNKYIAISKKRKVNGYRAYRFYNKEVRS